jgi:hypothetical protein
MCRWLEAFILCCLPLAAGPPGAFYGSCLQADSLANTPIGKGGIEISCRFRASEEAAFAGIRPFLIWSFSKKGYHAGTGGRLRVELRADDGTPAHAPAAQVLATQVQRLTLVPTSDQFYPELFFDRAPLLKRGSLYHLVFSNTDPDPEGNFVSVNALFNKDGAEQPGRPEGDWAMLFRTRRQPAWVIRRTPGSSESFTPILQVNYAGGRSQGVGYVEFWMGAPRPISASDAVRETFTVTGPQRKLAAVAVRVRRLAGGTVLHLALEQADGKVLAQGEAKAADLPVTASGALGGCGWFRLDLPTRPVLAPGGSYNLVLSAAGSGRFEAFPMRKGSDKGFSGATLFADGHAEFRDGQAWRGWEQWGQKALTNSDLQFYFTLAP